MPNRRTLLTGLSLTLGAALAPPVAFARQAASIAAPIRLEGGRVLLDVRLNGQGPLPFVIDTGAEISGLRQEVADRLSLRKQKDVRLNGKVFPLYEMAEVTYGGVIRQANVGLFGLSGMTLGGEGLLAAGVVTSFDSELEFERGVWRVHPGGAPAREGYEALPSEMKQSYHQASMRPFGDIAVAGQTIRPVWDTGMPRPLMLDYESGRRLGFTRPETPFAPVPLTSIRGRHPEPGRLTRVGRITIGSSTYDDVLAVVRPQSDGRGWGPVLGLPIMRTLDMAFERSSRRFSVRRNGLEPTAPNYGGSGLWVDEDGGRVAVSAVGIGSPAAAAGVRIGDVVDGLDFQATLQVLGGRDGPDVTLPLRRNGEAVGATFTMRAYL